MPSGPWLQRPTWLADNRSEPRWIDPRTALARVQDDECLGKVRDISLGGVSLSLLEFHPSAGDEIRVDVAFESEVVSFQGRVVYAVDHAWGSVVGVAFNGGGETPKRFLSRRYSERDH